MAPRARTPSGEAFTDLVLDTFRLNGALLEAGDRIAAEVGLTSARWQVLGAAVKGRVLTAAGIARRMGLTRQSVQRLVDLLVAEGILILEDNPDHRRAKLVRPTDEGTCRYARLDVLQRQWANRLTRGLDPSALRAARQVMLELQERLLQEARTRVPEETG